MSRSRPENPFECVVKVRYSHRGARAVVSLLQEGRAHVRFISQERAVTPGQAAVFYEGDAVLGGGFLE